MKGLEASSAAATTAAPPASGRPAPSRTERFRLAGPTIRLDLRTNAVRRDIADISLAGRLFAPHYARGVRRICATADAMLRTAPSPTASAGSQLLHGEEFFVLDASGGWAWGYCGHDHYVGYVEATALDECSATPTHMVTAPSAPLFAGADIKSRVIAYWPLGARFAATEHDDRFVVSNAGYLHHRHVGPLAPAEVDPVAVAERLIGVPYVWGGRAASGLDCSGLVQICLAMVGIEAPRDSDQQRALGRELSPDEALQRGDIVFFPGHVGLMMDSERLIHANAYWMAVTVEPLAEVANRLLPQYPAPIIARRRIEA